MLAYVGDIFNSRFEMMMSGRGVDGRGFVKVEGMEKEEELTEGLRYFVRK